VRHGTVFRVSREEFSRMKAFERWFEFSFLRCA
jgi:hypothetical protein